MAKDTEMIHLRRCHKCQKMLNEHHYKKDAGETRPAPRTVTEERSCVCSLSSKTPFLLSAVVEFLVSNCIYVQI